MLSNFLIGTLSGILFLLMKNIFVYDLFGLELQFLRGLRPQQVTEDVQHTSRIVSGWRSMDSSREHSAYFQQDPLAAFMAGDEVVSSAEQEAVGIFRAPEANELHSVTLRQLAIDRRIQRHCSSRTEHELPAIRQVVLIGAGMDTRPYRLSLPHTHWFEIDMPEVISLKEELLANISQSHEHSTTLQVKQCTRIPFDLKDSSSSSTHLPADLGAALASHGHVAAEPTLFLMEGLVMYLSPADIRALMGSLLPVAAPQSRAIMTQVSLKYHYLLTNPLVLFVIEKMTQSKSHHIARLFRSNLYSTDLGHDWAIESTANIGKEMLKTAGLLQWQPRSHVAGTPPRIVNTAENVLDIVLM
jgi:methyltransferase (TIGR00027 family)